MQSLALLVDEEGCYQEKDLNGQKVYIRAINKTDTELARYLDLENIEQEFLLARCIKKIDKYSRCLWSWRKWFEFIESLSYAEKNFYMNELRKLSYVEYEKEFKLYF